MNHASCALKSKDNFVTFSTAQQNCGDLFAEQHDFACSNITVEIEHEDPFLGDGVVFFLGFGLGFPLFFLFFLFLFGVSRR